MAGKLRKLREKRGCGRKKKEEKHHKKQEQLRRCKEKMSATEEWFSRFLLFLFPPLFGPLSTHTPHVPIVCWLPPPSSPCLFSEKKRGEKVGENGVSP